MFKLLLLAAAASGLAATGAAASSHRESGLPDFPTVAQPGECWARRPVGPMAEPGPHHVPRAQSVWTLQKGTGPGAVWRYAERPAAGGSAHPAVGAHVPLDWARVPCPGGRPAVMADAAPMRAAPPHVHPRPPAFDAPPAPHVHRRPPAFDAPPSLAGPAPGFDGGGPYAQLERPASHAHPHPPMHEGAPPHVHGGHAGHAMPPPAFEQGRPPIWAMQRPPVFQPGFTPPPFADRQRVAPWFGGRRLAWPGKTLR